MKVLLFDIDGTLINSGGAGRKSFMDALRGGFSLEAEFDDVPYAGKTDPSIVREYFELHGIEMSTRNFHIFFENYLRCLQKNVLSLNGHVKPGMLEILEICRNGNGNGRQFRMGLLTGNIEAGAKIKLDRFDLWQYFEFGAFASDHEERDQIARIAAERSRERYGNHLKDDDLIVIGDTPRDVKCGKAIGARTVAVATGPHSVNELRACGPSLALKDLSNVKDFLNWVEAP